MGLILPSNLTDTQLALSETSIQKRLCSLDSLFSEVSPPVEKVSKLPVITKGSQLQQAIYVCSQLVLGSLVPVYE